MSMFRDADIACPHCAHVERRSVVASLNAPRLPEVVDAIMAGRFQTFECESCGGLYEVDDPFVYVDFERQHWIMTFPLAWEEAWRGLEKGARETFTDTMEVDAPRYVREEVAPGFVVRVVFGVDALAEKILCLRSQIDDVVLETWKLDLMRSQEELSFQPGTRLRLMGIEDDGFRFFAPRSLPDGTWEYGTVVFERGGFDHVNSNLEQFASALTELGDGLYVDCGRVMLEGDEPVDF